MKDILVRVSEPQKDSFWSWVVCIGSFFVQFVAFGFQYSFGTFFVALLDKYGKSESSTALVGTLGIGLTFILGPFATYLCNTMGCRITACTGSILVMISSITTSVVTEMKWMFLTFSLLNGLGSTMLYFASLVVLIEYFHKHLSLANGIVLSGSGIGTLCVSLMSQNLISNYGLSVTYQVIGSLFVICFFAGLTFTPVQAKNEKLIPKDSEDGRSFTTKLRQCFKTGEQWKNKGFIVWTVAAAVVLFAYFIPSMYIVSIAKGLGVPPSKGGLLIGFIAITQTIGKIVIGKIADIPGVNRLTIMQVGLLVSAVINCLLPLAKSFEVLVAYSFVQGFCDGSFAVLLGLVTHDIVGKRLMADAIGCLYFVVALPMTLGPPVAGMFYDHMGNYHAVFFLSSGLVCTGICLMFAVPWLVPATPPEKDLVVLDELSDSTEDIHQHYDMSYVDERKIADLFGRKKARNLLLDRASLRNSIASTRASSFVLFSIVSEDQQRDISAYTSRQELSMLSGSNTPIRGTPSTRRRHLEVDSRTSMYSLRQSSISVAHSESCHFSVDAMEHEHPSIALETVQEVAEFERKISYDDTKITAVKVTGMINEENVVGNSCGPEKLQEQSCASEEEMVAIDDKLTMHIINEEAIDESYALNTEKPFTISADNVSPRSSWNSESNNSLKSSGTQLSEGTVDSGFGDGTWMGSSDVESRFSVENFIQEDTVPAIPRSCSWNTLTTTPKQSLDSSSTENQMNWEAKDDVVSTRCSSSELDWDYGDSKAKYMDKNIFISDESVKDYLSEGLLDEQEDDVEEEIESCRKRLPEIVYIEDMYSLELEKAFELVEEVEKLPMDSYQDRYFNLKEDFRETMV